MIYTDDSDTVTDTNNTHEREVLINIPLGWDSVGAAGFRPVIGNGSGTWTANMQFSNTTPGTFWTQNGVDYVTQIVTAYDQKFNFLRRLPNGNYAINCEFEYWYQGIGVNGNTTLPPEAECPDASVVTTLNANAASIAELVKVIMQTTSGLTTSTFNVAIPSGGQVCIIGGWTFKVRIPNSSVRASHMIVIPRNLRSAILADELNGLFTDSTFAEPVLSYMFPTQTGANAISPSIQFVHSTNYELIVDDASALANFALAEKDTPHNAIIHDKNMQTVLQSLPPCVVFDGGQIESTATTQLANRGILSSITSILGPVASAFFPEITPFVGIGNQLASALDTAFNI